MKPIAQINWDAVYAGLNQSGYAMIPDVLSKSECHQISQSYQSQSIFRSTISMERYRFGKGEYKYFSYPLPQVVQDIRSSWYPSLSLLANQWNESLSIDFHYPSDHESFLQNCQQKNQLRPTPLLLKYEPRGFNTLHQDLYGEIYFPFQVMLLLTQPGEDHAGGEFVLTEQVPRAQSKAMVVSPVQGDAVIFATNFRPVKGSKGYYRARFRHGISEVKSGTRYALGIIFHDAA